MSVQEAEIDAAERDGIIEIKVALPVEAFKVLNDYAAERGITPTEALRLFISNESFLLKHVQDGGKVLIETKDKGLQQVIF